MQCPSCKETIDDDSRYCDQCGEQIMVCSVCGRPGKGKRCIFDGKELVPASGAASTAQTVPQSGSTSSGASGDKVKLTSQLHGIMIEAQDGDIIGRKNGAFAGVFGCFNYVSGTHCKIVKTAAGWHIQDMGSTNGTTCEGTALVPNSLYPLANGATVKIADVELTATYDTAVGGTTRI
jgi:predicted component of type VI protein secretion system